jgi:cyclopropane fatty-acyl-phospholipid synthase-like methyltransferase
VLESLAGPNVLWVAEALAERMELTRGSRVLELGCGNGSGAVFLAREFGVQVWALDTTYKPDEIAARAEAAGCGDSVYPLKINARSLPFPHDWFDSIVALDSFHYFGTDVLYPRSMATYLRPGGSFGAVMPGLRTECEPPELKVELTPTTRMQIETYHDPDWWARHLSRAGALEIQVADIVKDGWRGCADWYDLLARSGVPLAKLYEREAAMWRADQGRELAMVRLVARKG